MSLVFLLLRFESFETILSRALVAGLPFCWRLVSSQAFEFILIYFIFCW